VWYKAILRADSCENACNDDVEPWKLNEDRFVDGSLAVGGAIYIGENSNVQDGCVITARQSHTVIGDGVTIGHLAQIHSATVNDHCLIGMGSIILEGSVIEEEAFVAAGAVVQPNTTVSSGELWVGNPARKLRDLTDKEREKLHYQASEVSGDDADLSAWRTLLGEKGLSSLLFYHDYRVFSM
jgi:carbonic anhydrase/acetyltransferase-like protein (isoleucine patch superfamily)